MNKFLLSTLATLFCMTSLQAEIATDSDGLHYLSKSKTKKQTYTPQSPITSNAGPKVKQGFDCFLSGEALFMKAATNGYIYTTTGYLNTSSLPDIQVSTQPTTPITTASWQPSPGESYSPPSTLSPGFRVSLGSMMNHGGWDFTAEYFWFYSSDSHSATATTREPFQLLQSAPEFGVIVNYYNTNYYPTKTDFEWNQRYQMVSIMLGRNYFTNRYLKLRPFVGARGTWQKKHFNLTYSHVQPPVLDLENPAPNYAQPPYDLTNKNFNKQWGIGVVAGLDSAWQFDDNFSIYGKFSVSELWFQQKANLTLDVTYIGIDTTVFEYPNNINYLAPVTRATIVNTSNINNSIQPMFDCALGLRLETYFSDFQYHILFQVGWEAQYWPNQILLLQPSNEGYAITTPVLDFSVQGLTAKLRFDF